MPAESRRDDMNTFEITMSCQRDSSPSRGRHFMSSDAAMIIRCAAGAAAELLGRFQHAQPRARARRRTGHAFLSFAMSDSHDITIRMPARAN